MRNFNPEGIILKSPTEIERNNKLLLARNMLQLAYASQLNFNEQDEGATMEEFINKYAEALGKVFTDHPEIIISYEQLMKDGKERQFNISELQELIKPYLPAIH